MSRAVYARYKCDVVRSMLSTRTIVLFSQRPVRKYCARVNVHAAYTYVSSCDTAMSQQWEHNSSNWIYIFLQFDTFFLPNFIDLTCLANFPVDPFRWQFTWCARVVHFKTLIKKWRRREGEVRRDVSHKPQFMTIIYTLPAHSQPSHNPLHSLPREKSEKSFMNHSTISWFAWYSG